MRTPILALAAVLALLALPMISAGGPATAVATVIGGVVLHAQEAPAPPAHVDIQVTHGGRGWHASPVWIAVGAIGLVLLIVLIIMAARGGGGTTTVVK
jgi:hypothetical protein